MRLRWRLREMMATVAVLAIYLAAFDSLTLSRGRWSGHARAASCRDFPALLHHALPCHGGLGEVHLAKRVADVTGGAAAPTRRACRKW
jgi:hypothetical protein